MMDQKSMGVKRWVKKAWVKHSVERKKNLVFLHTLYMLKKMLEKSIGENVVKSMGEKYG